MEGFTCAHLDFKLFIVGEKQFCKNWSYYVLSCSPTKHDLYFLFNEKFLLYGSINMHSGQWSKGIWQWLINWSISPMLINKITTFVDYSKRLKPLDTPLNEPTNQNSIKVSKKRISKRYHKFFKTSVINSPMSPPSLHSASLSDV